MINGSVSGDVATKTVMEAAKAVAGENILFWTSSYIVIYWSFNSSRQSCRRKSRGLRYCRRSPSKTPGFVPISSEDKYFWQDLQALQAAIVRRETQVSRRKKVPKECQTKRPKFSCTTNTSFFTMLSQKPRWSRRIVFFFVKSWGQNICRMFSESLHARFPRFYGMIISMFCFAT